MTAESNFSHNLGPGAGLVRIACLFHIDVTLERSSFEINEIRSTQRNHENFYFTTGVYMLKPWKNKQFQAYIVGMEMT